MQGRLRNRTRQESQYHPTFKQESFGGGENSDLTPSKISAYQVALLENFIAFPGYLETRSGTKRFSDTVFPGSGTFHSFRQHPTNKKFVLHRGTQLWYADVAMAAWPELKYTGSPTAAGTSGTFTIGNLTGSWSMTSASAINLNTSNSNAGVLYFDISVSGTAITISVYKDVAKLNKVAEGVSALNPPLTMYLSQQNNSGLGINVNAPNVSSNGTGSFTGSTEQGLGFDCDSNLKVINNDMILFPASASGRFVTYVDLTGNQIFSLGGAGGYGAGSMLNVASKSASTPYGYRYLYTRSRIVNASTGVPDVSLNRLTGRLDFEGPSSDSAIGSSFSEQWKANAISIANPNTVFLTLSTDQYATAIGGGYSQYTHLSLYRTLDIGTNGIDPVTGLGNNEEVYIWVADIDCTATSYSDTTTDNGEMSSSILYPGLDSRISNFKLKTRFWTEFDFGEVAEVTNTFIFLGKRGDTRVLYGQIYGDYKTAIGFHRKDVQFFKLDDGLQILAQSPDILSIICANKTYTSAYGNTLATKQPNSVQAIQHITIADANVGVADYGSFVETQNGIFMAVCSDRTIRQWNRFTWSSDLSDKSINKIVQLMITGSFGAYTTGAYYLWYRTASGDTYNTKCIRFGMGGNSGHGWSRVTGSAWVYPPLYMGAALMLDSSGVQKLIVLDSPGAAFYWVPPFLGYAQALSASFLTDKITTAGVAGTAIAPKVRIREIMGQSESHSCYHEESHLYLRNWKGASTNDLSALSVTTRIYADGNLATAVDAIAVTPPADIQIFKQAKGNFLQLEFELNGAGYQVTGIETHYQVQDKRQIGSGPADTTEATYQTSLGGGSTLKHWLTRIANLMNRATGTDYTLSGTAPTNTTGPDGKSYGLSFVAAARYLQADTTSYSDFAIAFWIRNATFPAAAAKLVLTLDGTDDLTVTWTNATTLSISGQTITTASVATTTWRHYALVRSGSTITVYENGVSLGTVTLATARGGTQIIISGTAETGAMEIYDLRVYNATLSAGAIDYLYDDTNDNSGTKVLPLA